MCWTCVDTHLTLAEKIYGKRASKVHPESIYICDDYRLSMA